MEQEQLPAVRSFQRESLGAGNNASRVRMKARAVLALDGAHDAAPIEHAGRHCDDRGHKHDRDHATVLTRGRSVAALRWIDLETPPVDTANEVQHRGESLILKPRNGGGAS